MITYHRIKRVQPSTEDAIGKGKSVTYLADDSAIAASDIPGVDATCSDTIPNEIEAYGDTSRSILLPITASQPKPRVDALRKSGRHVGPPVHESTTANSINMQPQCHRRSKSGSCAARSANQALKLSKTVRNGHVRAESLPPPATLSNSKRRKIQASTLDLPSAAAPSRKDPFDFMMHEGGSSDSESVQPSAYATRRSCSQPEPMFRFEPSKEQPFKGPLQNGVMDRPLPAVQPQVKRFAASQPGSKPVSGRESGPSVPRKRSSSLNERLGSDRISCSQPDRTDLAKLPPRIATSAQRHKASEIKTESSIFHDKSLHAKAQSPEAVSDPLTTTVAPAVGQRMPATDQARSCLPTPPSLTSIVDSVQTIDPDQTISGRGRSTSEDKRYVNSTCDRPPRIRTGSRGVILPSSQVTDSSCTQQLDAKRSRGSGFSVSGAAANGATRQSNGRNSSHSSQAGSCGQSPTKQSVRAMTLSEAQESGECARVRDELHYTMDGLSPSLPSATQHTSLADVVEAATTLRGRRVLRSEDDIDTVLATMAELPLHSDPSAAVSAAAFLLCFSRHAVDQPVVAKPAAMALLSCILQLPVPHAIRTDDTNGKGSPGKRRVANAVEKALKVAVVGGTLPLLSAGAHLRQSTSIALLTLAGVTDAHRAATTGRLAKASLRESGLLPLVANVAASAVASLRSVVASADVSEKGERERLQWIAHTALTVLEHSVFLTPANQAAILSVSLTSPALPGALLCRHTADVHGSAKEGVAKQQQQQQQQHQDVFPRSFTEWLIDSLTEQLAEPSDAPEQVTCQGWTQPGLAVIMNLVHNNAESCAAVASHRGAESMARIAATLLATKLEESSGLGDATSHSGSSELLTTALGVLINLAEGAPHLRATMASQAASSTAVPVATLLLLLCRLVSKTQENPSEPRMPESPAGGEFTADHLETREEASTAGISRMYAAVVAGFLVVDCPTRSAEAAGMLPGGTLHPLISAVECCLQFYTITGSLSEANHRNLTQLLVSLQSVPAKPKLSQTP